MGPYEHRFVLEAFDTNWISPVGPNIDAFETELATAVGAQQSVALSSGTAAIHLALVMLGVQRGDEVICQSFTFSGSCNPVMYQGATPVFIDSESETWNMDPNLLEAALKARGEKARAIIVVDLYGMPAKLDEIQSVANRFGVPVIEDAAEALGSRFQGIPCGQWGDFGIYSFNGNKIITTSGGGALIARDPEFMTKAKFLSTQARDPAPHYQHSQVGYNYRLSNVCAGIGRGQLRVLGERVEKRRAVFERYRSALNDLVEFVIEAPGSFANRWLTTILLPSPELSTRVRLRLEELNIESRPLWKPMHLQPVFDGAPAYDRGISAALFERGLCLPSGSSLLAEDQDTVINEIRQIIT